MKKATAIAAIRKIGIALIGFPVLILGIILIPLPGPGVLVCFVGLFILSFEFEWAERYRDKVKDQLSKLTAQAKQRSQALQKKAEDIKVERDKAE